MEEFVSTGTLFERDQIRCNLIFQLVENKENMVIAVTPLSYIQVIKTLFSSSDILSIELTDSAENIFERLVFSGENDVVYKDDDYKNKHKKHYLKEIEEDLQRYGSIYKDIDYHFNMSGSPTSDVVDSLIDKFQLVRLEG